MGIDGFIEYVIDYAASSGTGFLVFAGLLFLSLIVVSWIMGNNYRPRAKRLGLIAHRKGATDQEYNAAASSLFMVVFFKVFVPVGLGLFWVIMALIVLVS